MDRVRSIQSRVYSGLCRLRWEAGQTTAEYALVLLAAAAVAVVLINWAASDSGSLTEFFTAVIGEVKEKAGIGDGGN
jgi:Flp pilus assembly pilin Flp